MSRESWQQSSLEDRYDELFQEFKDKGLSDADARDEATLTLGGSWRIGTYKNKKEKQNEND
jgi:hypothetical protein